MVFNFAAVISLLQLSSVFSMKNPFGNPSSVSTAAYLNNDATIHFAMLVSVTAITVGLILVFSVILLLIDAFCKKKEATRNVSSSPCPSYTNFAPPSYKAAMERSKNTTSVWTIWRQKNDFKTSLLKLKKTTKTRIRKMTTIPQLRRWKEGRKCMRTESIEKLEFPCMESFKEMTTQCKS